MVQCDSCSSQALSGYTRCENCLMAFSPLHFDSVQSKSRPCCKSLPKGTHGTYRKAEKIFWPSRSELTRFVPDTSAPSVVHSPGSSIASRFCQVKKDTKLVVLVKKDRKAKQELPHTISLPTQDQETGGGTRTLRRSRNKSKTILGPPE